MLAITAASTLNNTSSVNHHVLVLLLLPLVLLLYSQLLLSHLLPLVLLLLLLLFCDCCGQGLHIHIWNGMLMARCYSHPQCEDKVREDCNMSDACILQDSASPLGGSVKREWPVGSTRQLLRFCECSGCWLHRCQRVLWVLVTQVSEFFDWYFYDIDHFVRLLYISVNISWSR